MTSEDIKHKLIIISRWVGRECESDIFTYLFYIVILNVPSWAHVSKEIFHFHALYIDE